MGVNLPRINAVLIATLILAGSGCAAPTQDDGAPIVRKHSLRTAIVNGWEGLVWTEGKLTLAGNPMPFWIRITDVSGKALTPPNIIMRLSLYRVEGKDKKLVRRDSVSPELVSIAVPGGYWEITYPDAADPFDAKTKYIGNAGSFEATVRDPLKLDPWRTKGGDAPVAGEYVAHVEVEVVRIGTMDFQDMPIRFLRDKDGNDR
jgi:hypothetical protein